jgi:hypothetical protein
MGTGGGFSMDNVKLEVIPEPSTYALMEWAPSSWERWHRAARLNRYIRFSFQSLAVFFGRNVDRLFA